MRTTIAVALVLTAVAAIVAWQGVRSDERRIASVTNGDTISAVVRKLGEPSLRAEHRMLSGPLFFTSGAL